MWHTTPYILFVFDKISLRITRGDFQTHTALKSVNQKNDIPIKTVLRITAKINSYIQQVFSSIHNSLYNGQGNSSNKKSAAQTQRQGTPLLRDICETAVENINHTSPAQLFPVFRLFGCLSCTTTISVTPHYNHLPKRRSDLQHTLSRLRFCHAKRIYYLCTKYLLQITENLITDENETTVAWRRGVGSWSAARRTVRSIRLPWHTFDRNLGIRTEPPAHQRKKYPLSLVIKREDRNGRSTGYVLRRQTLNGVYEARRTERGC